MAAQKADEYNPYITQCRTCHYWREMNGLQCNACHYRCDNDHGPRKTEEKCFGYKRRGKYTPRSPLELVR